MNFKGIYDSASEKDIFLVNTTINEQVRDFA